MIRIYCYCKKFMGTKEPLSEKSITHSVCQICTSKILKRTDIKMGRKEIIIEGKCVNQHIREKTVYGKLYHIYTNQKTRCRNKNRRHYKRYGARGLNVNYSFKELADWFKDNIKEYKGEIEDLSIGRIDHDKGYFLDNIKLQTMSENSREKAIRNNPIKKRPILIKDAKSGEKLITARSTIEASEFTEVDRWSMYKVLKGEIRQTKGFLFQYL